MLAHKLHELRARRAAGETGFTLVELLVVVVIIVALAAIAVPIFLNQKGKADEARLSSDATSAGKILASAISSDAAVKNASNADLASDTVTSVITYEGQSVSSDGDIKIFGYSAIASPKWDPATACVQVSIKGTTTFDATNTYHYKIQGGSGSGPCVVPAD